MSTRSYHEFKYRSISQPKPTGINILIWRNSTGLKSSYIPRCSVDNSPSTNFTLISFQNYQVLDTSSYSNMSWYSYQNSKFVFTYSAMTTQLHNDYLGTPCIKTLSVKSWVPQLLRPDSHESTFMILSWKILYMLYISCYIRNYKNHAGLNRNRSIFGGKVHLTDITVLSLYCKKRDTYPSWTQKVNDTEYKALRFLQVTSYFIL